MYEIISISFLFLSFYNIYKDSTLFSCFAILLTFLLHATIIKIYHEYFQRLNRNLEMERENIFLSSMKKGYFNEQEQANCVICFESLLPMEEVCELKCSCKKKYYHENCILDWFKKKNSCPFCRTTFTF